MVATTISARMQRNIIVPCGGEITVPVNKPVRLTISRPYPAGSGYTWALMGPIPRPGQGDVLVFGEETTPADIPGAPVTTTWLLEWQTAPNQQISGASPNEELRFALVRPWEADQPSDMCSCRVKFE